LQAGGRRFDPVWLHQTGYLQTGYLQTGYLQTGYLPTGYLPTVMAACSLPIGVVAPGLVRPEVIGFCVPPAGWRRARVV
jgi:hypothetical protein